MPQSPEAIYIEYLILIILSFVVSRWGLYRCPSPPSFDAPVSLFRQHWTVIGVFFILTSLGLVMTIRCVIGYMLFWHADHPGVPRANTRVFVYAFSMFVMAWFGPWCWLLYRCPRLCRWDRRWSRSRTGQFLFGNSEPRRIKLILLFGVVALLLGFLMLGVLMKTIYPH